MCLVEPIPPPRSADDSSSPADLFSETHRTREEGQENPRIPCKQEGNTGKELLYGLGVEVGLGVTIFIRGVG